MIQNVTPNHSQYDGWPDTEIYDIGNCIKESYYLIGEEGALYAMVITKVVNDKLRLYIRVLFPGVKVIKEALCSLKGDLPIVAGGKHPKGITMTDKLLNSLGAFL